MLAGTNHPHLLSIGLRYVTWLAYITQQIVALLLFYAFKQPNSLLVTMGSCLFPSLLPTPSSVIPLPTVDYKWILSKIG